MIKKFTLLPSGKKACHYSNGHAFIVLILLTLLPLFLKAQQRTRVYASTQSNSVQPAGNVELLGPINISLANALNTLGIQLQDLGRVTNPANAADPSPQTFSTLSATYLDLNLNPIARVRVGARVQQDLNFAAIVAGNVPVTIKLGNSGTLAETLLDGLSLQAVLNGNPVGPVLNKSDLRVAAIGNRSAVEVTFTPGTLYNGVRVLLDTRNTVASLNVFQNIDVYDAYYYADAATLANCDAPFDVLFGNSAVVAALGSVTNPFNTIDNDPNSFATINSGANVLSNPADGTSLTAVFPALSKAGDTVKAIISYPGTLLEAQLLSSISIQTLLHNEDGTETVAETFSGSSLLRLELLTGSTDRAYLSFKTNQPFNRIKISYGGAAVALQSVRIYDLQRVAPSPVVTAPGLLPGNVLNICLGSSATFAISNPEPGATYQYFATPSGGTPITAGVAANGTEFTPAGLVAGANVFYVSLSRAGCGNEISARVKFTINASQAPLAADLTVTGNESPVCAGTAVVLTPGVVPAPSVPLASPVFRWYKNADRTGEITNGMTEGGVSYTLVNGVLTVNGLAANVTYYLSVTADNGSGCESPAGQLKPVPVVVNPLATPGSIVLSSTLVQCPGANVVLAPGATGINNPVFSYYFDAAKTQLITNGSTAGPVTFTVTGNGVLTIAGLPNGADVTYYVTVKGDNACENATGKPVNIQVSNTLSPPEFAASTVAVCGTGATATFQVTNYTDGLTYTVYDASTGGSQVTANVSATGNTITFNNINANATYYVGVTGTGGCMSTARTAISIEYANPASPAAITSLTANGSNGGNVCTEAGGSILLSATTNVANPVFYFYQGTVLLGSNSSGTYTVTGFTPGVAATYTVGVSGTGVCETLAADRASITYTPATRPGNPILTNPAVEVATAGSTVQLIVNPIPAGAVSFQWYKDAVLLAETSGTLTLSNITPSDEGVYRVLAVGSSGCTSAGSAEVTLRVTSLVLWKSYTVSTGANSVSGGETVTYIIHLRNTGNAPVTGYTIKDPLPANTTAGQVFDGGTNDNGVFTWTGVSVNPGATVTRRFSVVVNADLTGVGAIRNIPYVGNGINPDMPGIPPDPADPAEPGDPAQTGTNIPVNPITSNITWKSAAVSGGGSSVRGGETITYTIYVRNTGNQAINPLIVRDALPTGTTFVSAANGGTLIGSEVVYSNLAVGVGQTTSVTFAVKVDANLTGINMIHNVAVSSDGVNPDQPSIPPNPTDPGQPGNPATPGTDVPVTQVASTVNWKSFSLPGGAASVRGGENVTYTIHVRNTGNQDLTNIQVRDAVPAHTTFVSAANGGALTSGEVRFTGLAAGVGQTVTVSFVVKVDADLTGVNQIFNLGYVKVGAQPEQPTLPPNPSDPGQPGDPGTTGTVIPVTQSPDLNATLAVTANSSNGKAHAGDLLTYTITIQNTGNVGLNSVTVTGPVPAATSFAASNGGTLNGNNVNFTIPAIPVGQSAMVIYQVSVNNDLGNATTISNMASVTASGLTRNTNRADIATECIAPGAPPQVTLANTSICAGSTNTLTVNNPDPALTYRFYTQASGGTPEGQGISFTTPALTAPAIYYVEAVRTAGQCVSATRTAVSVNVLPQLAVPVVTVQQTTPASITFAWTPVAGAAGYEYSIDNGATYLMPTGGAAAVTQLITGLAPNQSVTFRVRALGSLACQQSTASIPVTGTAENPQGDEVYIPNAFTPNGDGRNDQFEIFGVTIASYTMDVYNQWGQLIYRSSGSKNGWDGTYKGVLQPSGVYVYKINVTTQGGSRFIKKGNITLLR